MQVPVFPQIKLLLQLLYFEYDIPPTEKEVRSEMDPITIQVLHTSAALPHTIWEKLRVKIITQSLVKLKIYGNFCFYIKTEWKLVLSRQIFYNPLQQIALVR